MNTSIAAGAAAQPRVYGTEVQLHQQAPGSRSAVVPVAAAAAAAPQQHVLRRSHRRNASSVSGIDLDTFEPPPPDKQLETPAAPSPPAPEQLTAAPATEDAVAAVVTAVPEPEAAQLRPVLRAVSG